MTLLTYSSDMLIIAQVFPQIKAFISFPRCNVDPGWLNKSDLAFCILHSNSCIYQKTWDYIVQEGI